jgi:hypothetical protein
MKLFINNNITTLKMEEIFNKTFGITFKLNVCQDRINNTEAIEIKNEIHKLIFTVKKFDYLYVNNIAKYKDDTYNVIFGKEIIKRVIIIGNFLKVKYVELNDLAMINLGDFKEYSIALAPFEIITTGTSWYNKLGFKSESFTEEKLKNEKINNTQFNNLIDDYKLLNQFNEHFSDTSNKTLKEIFMYLKRNYINRNNDRIKMTCQQSNIIEILTIYLCDILHYETNLIYNL